MSTYAQLMEQAKELMAMAEKARLEEKAKAVAEIRALMAEKGVTLQDLTGNGRSGRASKKDPANAKYRGPNGELWSGGRGRKPQWVQDALAAGKTLEEFAI